MQRTGQACPGNQKKKKKRKEKRKEKARGNTQEKRKKEGRGNIQRPEKKKKSKVLDEAHVQVHMDIFVIYLSNSPHSVFSPF